MSGESFIRERLSYRAIFHGMKTNATPDSLPPDKYPFAQNIRSVSETSVETRPGQTLITATAANVPITDMRAYAALNTDNLPRFLMRNTADQIYLDNGAVVGTLTPGGLGATFIPFRPDQSPNPYMYIANGADYQKFSAPDAVNTVIAQKVGIAEPQSPCESGPQPQQFTEILSPGGTWNTGGTASAWAATNRSTDLVVASFADPALVAHFGLSPRWSIQVSPTVQYQIGEVLYFNAQVTSTTPPFTTSPQTFITIIEDVIPPLAISMQIASIYYFTGSTGRCVIVLSGITAPSTIKNVSNQSGSALPQSEVIAQLRRGALVRVGTETCYVLSVTTGPDNQICFETVLGTTHIQGETVIGLPTIIVNGVTNASLVAPSTPIVGDQGNVETFSVAVGIGTLTAGSPGGGPTGTVLARPTPSLNGWGPNAHVGAYEMGVNQGYNWGLDPNTTSPYTNAANANDGNLATFASAVGQHTHTYYGCVWTFSPITPQSGMVLNINSRVLANGDDGFTISDRSAGIWYSIDAGTTWNQIYNQGSLTSSAGPRTQQWDSIPLSSSQDVSKVQVMAFTDSHDNMVHYVYEINITQGAATISLAQGAFQEDDYLHFSFLTNNPNNLIEARLQFDVADGTFLDNYYYYSVRPADLVSATAATAPITSIGAMQASIQETNVAEGAGSLNLSIGSPTVAGNSQWTEIMVPISELTRIGGDQSKTLAKIVGVQLWVNALGTLAVSLSSITFVGGGQPDVGQVGEPYRYRARPRSSVTGAKGNPSPNMRYGVGSRRQGNQVDLPSAAYDSQIDTWDVFRFGGAVAEWRFIGSTLSSNNTFLDNYSDDAALAGEALDFDNFEPWPSVDVPFSTVATQVTGTEALVTIASPTNALRFLPGNLVRIGGQNVYTLRKRPVLTTGTTYLFEFVECAEPATVPGFAASVPVAIYEPEIARQFLPYMWGPDAGGTVFACGDPLRLGTLYYSKNNAPDAAPDSYNQELCPPSEPLMGGVVIDGLSFVASTERWWRLYPGGVNQFTPQQQSWPRGVAAPHAICTDGETIYWWAKDGIWSSKDGSLTDADLYNLFPHEGVVGVPSAHGSPSPGRSVLPPDYSRAGGFRLAYANSYLYAVYHDANDNYNTLICDLRHGNAWSVDAYASPVSVFYHPEQQAGTITLSTTLYPEVVMADVAGNVYKESYATNDTNNTVPITVLLATREDPGGDIRAPKQWGDIFVDIIPAAPAGVAVVLMSLGVQITAPLTIPTNSNRVRSPLDVGSTLVSDFLGLYFTWIDDFTTQAVPSKLRIWDVSYVIQPASTSGWRTFGSSLQFNGYGHIREIAIAWVSNSPIILTITSYDGQSPLPITIPSSGGAYQKVLFPVSANKGQLYKFQGASTLPFQIFLDDSEVHVGEWGRSSAYMKLKTLSGAPIDSAPL